MHDQAHVGFVDTHSERVGRDHYARPATLPGLFLGILALGREACVVILGRNTVCKQNVTHLLCLLSVKGIYYCRTANAVKNMQQFLWLVLGLAHDIYKVLSGKAHAEAVLLREAQLLLDILHHLGRCRCSERKHGHIGENLTQLLYLTVCRTEIVTPLRDAVSLIDRDHGHLDTLYLLKEKL